MAETTARRGKAKSRDRYMQVMQTVEQALGNVAAVMASRGSRDPVSILVKQRGDEDWIAVLKAYDTDDGIDVVAFGVGFDWMGAVFSLNSNVAADRWRPDKPYKDGGRFDEAARSKGAVAVRFEVDREESPAHSGIDGRGAE